MDADGDSINIIDSIRTQLEGLKRTEDGSLLYRLIERGLGKQSDDSASTDEAFLTFMYTLLERYAKNRDGDPITRIKVRVIQQRITPYLMREDEPEDQAQASTADESSGEDEDNEAEPVKAVDVQQEPAAEEIVEQPQPVETPAVVDEKAPEISTKSKSRDDNEPVEFDLELMDPDEIDREIQAEAKLKLPPEQIREPAPAKEKKPEVPRAVQEVKKATKPKPEKVVKAKPKPVEAKKKVVEEKPKSKPAVVQAKQPQTKKPEAPKKPVKLELVEPTDLTRPHTPEKVEEVDVDEGYIDLGGDAPTSARPAKPAPGPTARPIRPSAAARESTPEKKQEPAKQQLMPRAASTPKREPAPPKGGEPSQERVEKLHEAFVHKMAESITRSQEYHRLLKSNLKALKVADSENDFKDLKSLIMKGMEDLLKGNEVLGRDLDSTSHYLKIARLDRALLKDELGRIKSNTTIDDLTALQNKDAFIKQLESEISRVNRYGFSFAIAVLDIDDLKSINTNYGRDAGDEVIRCYARQILSQFRSYDLVARHKSDEFLLLFPNTQKEGALRAVEKAQKRAANLFINHKDKNIKVPTFTSVLTTYTPGDQPDTLLRRTTEALVQAQRQGRDQVIMALPTS